MRAIVRPERQNPAPQIRLTYGAAPHETCCESRKSEAHGLRLSEPAFWGPLYHRFPNAQPTHPDKAINGSKSYAFVV
ncbi:hypothetical protein BN2475_150167 [Paraburkholderia ribeironis]|uniref:Uncharacterized protein n=1 Tax=Paraburkholderia ribeironis TaxID=1247936 RepID=A0A1N7RV41_9BURK|nr:hypothetical protein BN2475_150167 [Paraburkholderia ribeironis]